MANDLFKAQLFNDGEGLVFGDLNDLARMGHARVTDQLLERTAGYIATSSNNDPDLPGEAGQNPATFSLIYTMSGGDCMIVEGSAATKVALRPGTLFQKIAGADGNEPSFLPFTINSVADVDLTIAAGDATNPRVDILQCKLEWESAVTESRDFKDATTGVVTTITPNKRRRVKATFSIKQGTAAATPVYPAPDTGYALLAAVRVPATWTTGTDADGATGTALKLYQCTVPLGIEGVTVHPHEFDYAFPNSSGWRRGTGADGAAISGSAYAPSNSAALAIWCPNAGATKRIVGIRVVGKWVSSGTCTLTWYESNGTTAYANLSTNGFSLTGLVSIGGGFGERFLRLGEICDSSLYHDPSTANGVIGDPAWTMGVRSGPARRELQAGRSSARAMLRIDAGTGSQIYSVTWYLAG